MLNQAAPGGVADLGTCPTCAAVIGVVGSLVAVEVLVGHKRLIGYVGLSNEGRRWEWRLVQLGRGPGGPWAYVVVIEQVFLLLVADSSLTLPTISRTTHAPVTAATVRAALATIRIAFTTTRVVAGTTTVSSGVTAAVTALLDSVIRRNGAVVVKLMVVVSLGRRGRFQSGSKDQAGNQSKQEISRHEGSSFVMRCGLASGRKPKGMPRLGPSGVGYRNWVWQVRWEAGTDGPADW